MSISEKRLAGLDSYIEQVRTDWNGVGLAVAVVRGDELLYARGFGKKEIDKPAKIDRDTLFQVGSTSKAITAAALGILVDEGKVHWDDPIIDYWPKFQLQDPWLTQRLTIRDALTHRSGIVGPVYFALGIMSSDEAIRQLRYSIPESAFRDSYRYNNLMYALAGKVVEAASGMSWHDFIKRRLLQPLKMNRSGTSPYDFWDAKYVTPTYLGSVPGGRAGIDNASDSNVAMPHGWDENGLITVLPWQSYDNAAPAGSMVSSVGDMANWLILHLNKGRFEKAQVLNQETVEELHAAQNLHVDVKRFPFEESSETYAMGWRRAEFRGHVHLAHGGGIVGFPSYVALLPTEDIGIVVLSNGPANMRDTGFLSANQSIAFWIFDRFLGAPTRDWKEEFFGRMRDVQEANRRTDNQLSGRRLRHAPPSLPLGHYAGSYADHKGNSGPVSVSIDAGQLKLSFPGEGAYSARLEHWHHDIFRLRSSPAHDDIIALSKWLFVSFVIDQTGVIGSMSAFGASFQRLPERKGE